MLQMVQIVC